MRAFWDLLPYRIDEAVFGRWFRRARVVRRRRASRRGLERGEVRRRLYVDLAVISRDDAGTGIQRVVRAIALTLLAEPQDRWEIHFVAARRRRAYHVIDWPDAGAEPRYEVMRARPGDVFLGLDFSLDAIRFHRRQLARFRADGGRLWFLICDLLPVERPEWFSPNNVIRYKAWLNVLAELAEGFLSISRQTEIDLTRVLAARYGLEGGYSSVVLPMGHNIRESMIRNTTADEPLPQPRFDVTQPFVVMVGTLEPRKGHADVVGGFSEAWQQGLQDRLVLIGRMGWKTEALQTAIRSHPEFGRKLLWFHDVGDAELESIYRAAHGVILGSYAEGFGLPLIEALGHGKPVLARDIPIFRMHAASGLRYFPAAADVTVLARSILNWREEVRAGSVTVIRPSAGWREAVTTLLAALD